MYWVVNKDISMLFNLHSDISQKNQFIWSESVTVHDSEVTPSTGNFRSLVVTG